MVKYYEMVEPVSGTDSTPEFNILSEQEIIDQFADYCCLMHLTRLNKMPSRQDIIDEWCILHWATEVGGRMKLLLKTDEYCYYDYKGVVVWVKNIKPYTQRTYKENMQSLKNRGEL